MIRKALLTLGVMALAVSGFAQGISKCGTSEFYKEQLAKYPNMLAQKAQLEQDIQKAVKTVISNPNAKTTGASDYQTWAQDTTLYHIPVVVHVIYDFAAPADYGSGPTTGPVLVSDDQIYDLIRRMNIYYSATDPALSGIINPFKSYIGNAHIKFHLANKDPKNNATRGIVRSYSYLAYKGDESAKIAPWPPDQYLNIYLENTIGRGIGAGVVLAYATFPESYSDNPYSQGVISRTDQAYNPSSIGDVYTIAHEVGHFLSLQHPWNSNDSEVEKGIVCGDDLVDDTPPTLGHFSCGNKQLYDTVCAKGYFKQYDSIGYYIRTGIWSPLFNSINYPDTTNTQNIMDYSACLNEMFTKGQVARMRGTLRSNIGSRSNLISNSNISHTGIVDTLTMKDIAPTDITPTALFSVNKNVICADNGTSILFTNRSYNDTIQAASWTFSNGASNATSSSVATVSNTFSTPGWVTVGLTVNGNNTGSNTYTRSDLVYAMDPTPINPQGYFQEFNAGGDLNKYPIFNYYGVPYKWEVVANAGAYDKTCIRYANYDSRIIDNSNASATPGGNYSDFFTPPFDLSAYSAGGLCNLSFYTAGAYRTGISTQMNDKVTISASTNCGNSWVDVDSLKGGQIANNGMITTPFTPIWSQWREQSIKLKTSLRTSSTMFRIRYLSGTNYPTATGLSMGTGNNFYLDRISISNAPLGVKNGVIVTLGMNVAPNPTNGAAIVSLNGGDNSVADLSVMDVTGKLVYSISTKRAAANTIIEIPASALSVKGMYLVKVVTNGATETQKLVVY